MISTASARRTWEPTSASATAASVSHRFAYRAILPLLRDRLEASLGAGAGYAFVKPPPLGGYEHWLVYGQVGANYALEPLKRSAPA